MWFVGLLIGGVLGAMAGGVGGFFAGGFIGGLIGAGIGMGRADKLARLEARVEKIEKEWAQLRATGAPLMPQAASEAAAAQQPEPPAPEAEAASSPAALEIPAVAPPEPEPQPIEAPQTVPAAMPVPEETRAAPLPPDAYEPVAAHAASLPPPPTIPPASVPAGPSLLSRLISGNIVAKVGVVVLFLGVGFLLKFAYDRGMMPPQLRLAGVAVIAAALFLIGWRLRASRHLYAMILQGAASGLAYLDVYFALKTYAFIGPVTGFGLFALLGVATTFAAVRQDASVLAVLGLLGAFSAPILAATGSGNHVLLFSYYTLLNVFVLAVSWFKAWRALNLTGWFFTFAVGVFWGATNYRPELFATVEPFVLLFFALYLVIPVLFATRQPPELKGIVDATLVFGTPAAVAVMQAGLVRDLPYGLAWSAALGGALYAILAALVWRHENMRLLRETYVALGVGLGTLAIFFGFDAYPTFALWTLEGTAILWIGLRQRQALAWRFAVLVQLAGAFMFILEYGRLDRPHAIFNDATYGCLWIAVAGLMSASLLRRYADRLAGWESGGATLALLWGALWWAGGGLDALDHALPENLLPAGATLFLAASFFALEVAGRRAGWAQMRALAAAHALALALAALSQFADGGHALGNLGYLAWPLGFAVAFWSLLRQEHDGVALGASLRYLVLWATLALLATWEEIWLLREREYGYGMLLAAAGHAAAWLRFRLRERGAEGAVGASVWVLCWGLVFWFAQGGQWLDQRLERDQLIAAGLVFAAGTTLLYEWAGRRLSWTGLRHASIVMWLVLPLAAVAQFALGLRPWQEAGWAAWPIAFISAYWVLARQSRDGVALLVEVRHVLLWGTLAALATLEQGWMFQERQHGYGMLLAGAGYAVAYLRFHLAERSEAGAARMSLALLAWATLFWFAQGGTWAHEQLETSAFLSAGLGLTAASALAFELAGRGLAWPSLRHVALILWPAMAGVALLQLERQFDPSTSFGWLAWPGALFVAYWSLRRQENDELTALAPARHALGLWLATFLAGREAVARISDLGWGASWVPAAWGLCFAAAIAGAVQLGERARWPVAGRIALYRVPILGPIVLLAALWVLYANLRAPGAMAPLPYLPLLNPLDVASVACLGAILAWSRGFEGADAGTGVFSRRIAYALGFAWVNAIALRSIHFWDGVPYRLAELLDSVLVQATLSLLWTATAFALMFGARRNGRRPMWLLGAGLLAVVVLKLLLVDLAGTGTVARIVSFMGVGALLLVIGYVAPVPPGEPTEASRD